MSASVAAQLIHDIEGSLVELRKQYTMFLNDIINVEPYEAREMLNGKIKRLRNLNFNRTEDQFRANNLIAKAQSHFQLWDRQLERKYTGSPHLRRKRGAEPEQAQPAKKAKARGVVIGDPRKQRAQVETLYDEYMKLNLSLGGKNVINFTKFQNFIQNQTEKIKAKKGVERVQYEVAVKEDKVIIRSKILGS